MKNATALDRLLGLYESARTELGQMSNACDPDVFELQCQIYMRTGQWEFCYNTAMMLTIVAPERPAGWRITAEAAHALGRPEHAYPLLLSMAGEFGNEPDFWRNVARYAREVEVLDFQDCLELHCA